jgi:hypothetical protein
MKNRSPISNSGAPLRRYKGMLATVLLPASLLLLGIQPSQADSATWNLNPTSGDWTTPDNWTPATVPNGPRDTATFAQSSQTSLSILRDVQVSQTIFNPGASGYTITVYLPRTLSIGGLGVANLSGTAQNFVVHRCRV